MTALDVSLIIASWQRPEALARCLTAVGQLEGCRLQIIVVACDAGCRAARAHPLARDLTILGTEKANISAARNLGLNHAAAPVVAFIDDDAVPEPTWLIHLIKAFDDPDIQMAGGQVLGRNGISTQWGDRWLTALGDSSSTQSPQSIRRTEGTNMAVRRELFSRIGGFDPAFAFFHDDADLNMRAGRGIAYMPEAIVHHGFAAGPYRRRDRVPKDLEQIGRSQMVFLRKHADPREIASAWDAFQCAQHDRLVRHLQTGALEPRDLRRLMGQLAKGGKAGRSEPLPPPPEVLDSTSRAAFRDLRDPAPRRVLLAWHWQKRRLHARACELADQGVLVTAFCLSLTTLYHQIRYRPEGYWLQTGGVFGRANRSEPILQVASALERVTAECRRQAVQRGFDKALTIEHL